VKHFVYYSQMSHDLLREYLPHDAAYYWLPNAIETEYAPPAAVRANNVFMFLGRLAQVKGPEMFARAAAAEQVPCRFIGEGTAREAIARANPQATLSGWMSHRDGMQALRTARALVFPSLWYETLGLVVLEAAAIGIPSIVPDSCAARESVVDGVTGLYFRSGDESDLRAKIALMKDPEVAGRLGHAAHERFWTPPGCGIELHRQRLEKIYTQVLAARLGAAEGSDTKPKDR
jgi:glycosyltransferase involved in cell wall biosynthesis